MHLIQLIKNKLITTLPTKVPYELAKSASEALSDVPTVKEVDWEVNDETLLGIKENYDSLEKNGDLGGISSKFY